MTTPSDAVVHVRASRDGDASDIASLITLLGYPCLPDEAIARMRAIATEHDQALFVADRDGHLCGLLALDLMYYLPLGARTCRITALVVATAHQGEGVGRELLQSAEAWARQAGAARIEVTSAAHRDSAHAFYRACGYSDGSVRFVKRLGDA
ncbi:MAG TPA: GNAT family N-acetyltransferase [Xanthomonadaceae bacterium]|jgi:GNAT superfamily N-acetyltransferase|nr:GNAT family N-acetyltransferase [Xanthomonadaceae bacterium]